MKVRAQLVLVYSIIIAVTVFSIAYFAINMISASFTDAELEQMRNIVNERENSLQNLHARASEDLVFALQNPLFVQYFDLPETKKGNVYKDGVIQFTDKQRQIKTELEQWIHSFQNKFQVDETCLIDTSGQEHTRLVLKNTAPDTQLSPDESSTPFFVPSFKKEKNQVHIQYPYVSPDTHRWVFAYTSPIVLGDGEKPAFYHFEMPLAVFQDSVSIDSGRMYVFDPQGFIIADSQHQYPTTNISEKFDEYFPRVDTIIPQKEFGRISEQLKTQESGTISYVDEDGDTYYAVFKKLPTFGWILLYQKPESLILSGFHTVFGNAWWTIGIITVITTIPSLIAVFVISNKITRPISRLESAAKDITDGILDTKIQVKGSGEIAKLEESFSKMASSLKKTIELEKQLATSEQKLKSEKLAIVGELSSRLAHDIRNPLSVIKATVEIIRLKSPPDEKTSAQFERITHAIDRIEFQINNTMDFVRTKHLEVRPHSIQEILNTSISQIKIPPGITITKPDEDIEIKCDGKQLETVFINIITNAIQAMGNNGSITIRMTDHIEKISLEIQDSGPGISEDVLPKIFEPLFTTKQQGTGLGLVSCKNIIEQHGGTINAYNNPTRFVIKLPKSITTETKPVES
ncbi:MAG: sensor histidine kinase [Nitrosopumilaceae archaeon]|nr:sensor histidine kinase [Nitrosopumilaceae archaeon]